MMKCYRSKYITKALTSILIRSNYREATKETYITTKRLLPTSCIKMIGTSSFSSSIKDEIATKIPKQAGIVKIQIQQRPMNGIREVQSVRISIKILGFQLRSLT